MPGTVHPRSPRWLRRSLYTVPYSCLSLVGCISSSHATGMRRDRGLAEVSVVQYVCAQRNTVTILLLRERYRMSVL
uniref:Secreted protein n=1 Tax=Mesocestoides corti TaxID=53468 RepID=A0A5K3EUF1_MESCO